MGISPEGGLEACRGRVVLPRENWCRNTSSLDDERVFASQIGEMLVFVNAPTIFKRNLGFAAHLAGLVGP